MKPSNRSWERLAWLYPFVVFAAVGLGLWVVMAPPDNLVGLVLAALLVLSLAWVFVSVLWPARADKTCPQCEATAVGRLEQGSTHGLVCAACGWTDESSSSWLLAEDEGVALEGLVLDQRRQGRTKHDPTRRPDSDVDTRPQAH